MPHATDPADIDNAASKADAAIESQPPAPERRGLLNQLGWRRFGRNVWLLLFFTLGKGFQISIGAVTINLYVYSLGYQQGFVGLFAGTSALASLLMAIPAGMIADRLGRKPVLLITGLITPLTLVATALSTSAPALLIAGFSNGVFASFYWVTAVPMLADNVDDEARVGALGMNSFLLLGMGSLGSLIGGFVPELAAAWLHLPAVSPVPLRYGVLSAAVIVALAALPLFWLRMPQRAARRAVQGETGQRDEQQGKRAQQVEAQAPLAAPARALLVLGAMLLIPDLFITFGEGIVLGLLQLFFHIKFGLEPGALGGLFTVAGILGGLAGLGAPLLVKRWGKLRTATSLQLATAPAMLVTGFSPWLPLAAGAEYMRTLMRALIDPVYSAFAIEQLPEERRATLFGFYSVTWGLGFSFGPSLAGWLQEYVGLWSPFVVGAICLTIAPTMLLAFFGRRRRPA